MQQKIVKYVLIVLITLGGLSADFYSKKWALNTLKNAPTVTAIKGVLDFGFAENRGMVFGIMNNKMNALSKNSLVAVRIIILIGLTIFIAVSLKRSVMFLLPFLLFWAGAIGNLIDPFLYGYVVDFIHIQLFTILNWPFFFNLADAYVTIGIGLMLLNEFFVKKGPVQTSPVSSK
ncbi:MAG TPA: signal peptidase II [Chitinispirillaceae bacterium]|nr:signal peptidase II [Chitinispirillaceae bacterium]